MKAKSWIVFVIGIVMAAVAPPTSAQESPRSRSAAADGKRLLQQLVEATRKEGQLDFMLVSSIGERRVKEMLAAFSKRFGLNITMNADLSGQESQKFNQAVAETKSGIPPTFDLMEGTDENALSLKDVGGTEYIENWEALLAEIAPEAYKLREKISPVELTGHAFLWSTRTTALLYNPKVISERDIPKTWKQMGDPKYKGAFSVPPWISRAVMGILKYDKGEWLEVVKGMGRNKQNVLTYDAGVQRMLLGDLKFLYSNSTDYFEEKDKDPKAPIGLTYFEDFTSMGQVHYVVRKGARHPNAAKLFALWAAGVEANEIFEKGGQENQVFGRGPISRQIAAALKERNIKPLSWFDSPQTVEKFRWLSTPEGKEYSRAIARAHREGK